MIGIDTNVLARFFAKDDLEQFAAARQFFRGLSEARPGFVSLVVLVELVWVLRNAVRMARDDIVVVVTSLLDAKELVVQDASLVRRALDQAGEGIDFADALTAELGTAAGAQYTVTFDRSAAGLPGMLLLDA